MAAVLARHVFNRVHLAICLAQAVDDKRREDWAKINRYHQQTLAYFIKRLKETPDGDSNLLENSLLIYGSPMGNSNVHNHKRCPLFLAGHAGGQLKGGLHLRAADGTPLANVM